MASGVNGMSDGAKIRCDTVLLADGWAADFVLAWDTAGSLVELRPTGEADIGLPRAAGPVVPGMANLHSHAFQRLIAGLTECADPAGSAEDDFWSWRAAVYRHVTDLTPDHVEAIAARLYADLLRGGFTAVGEFHYLHHDPDGNTYADPAEMAHRHIQAAAQAGIGLTLLPVLYSQGGFGGQAPEAGQRRYLNDLDGFAAILDSIAGAMGEARLGVAAHSLRAVGPEALAGLVELIDGIDPAAPRHIHVAEQIREVEACLVWSGARPVEWLLANADLGPLWCLVHATHMTAEETIALAHSGAVAGLCPTTEADPGDGIFPAVDYLTAGGAFGVGTDSHVRIEAAEELRWLEYGQRLIHQRRNLLRPAGTVATGAALYQAAFRGGATALGRPIGALALGKRADFVILDGAAPLLRDKTGDDLIDTYVFAGGRDLVRDVFVAGRRVVAEGRHVADAEINRALAAQAELRKRR